MASLAPAGSSLRGVFRDRLERDAGLAERIRLGHATSAGCVSMTEAILLPVRSENPGPSPVGHLPCAIRRPCLLPGSEAAPGLEFLG